MRKYPAHTHIYTWKNIITKKITYLHSCISLLDRVQLFDIKVNPCQQPPSPSIFVTTKISGRIFRSSAPLFAQQPFVRDTHRTFGEIERQLRGGGEGGPSFPCRGRGKKLHSSSKRGKGGEGISSRREVGCCSPSHSACGFVNCFHDNSAASFTR